MQLYALEENRPISAVKAAKGKDYICPECRSAVRIRGGPSRQIHFYHRSLPRQCRQHEKSEEHIHTQLRLLSLLPGARMEHRFPGIERIADIAWIPQKIVFEIQCSPISLEEAKGRVLDYGAAGYSIVWILHSREFNKKNLSAAESFLRSIPCYFTDIDKEGHGTIYDQFEVIRASRRLFKGPPLQVALEKFFPLPSLDFNYSLPQAAKMRIEKWKCYADGDLFCRIVQEGGHSSSVKKMAALEKRLLEEKNGGRLPLKALFVCSYRALIDDLLKAFSRR